MPDEEIVRDPSGYRIVRRVPLPVEIWNAQLSLLTGMVAGRMMLDARIGVLRTMPPPRAEDLADFRARAAALGRPWSPDIAYGEYLRGIDPMAAESPAILQAAATLFRGADYVAFDGAVPEQTVQAAIASPYAHVTAPLRRLIDRWGLVVCETLSADRPVPAWARSSLPELPTLMRTSGRLVSQLSSAALDRVEAALLRDRAGEVFDAMVVEVRGARARVQIADPAITAQCPSDGLVAGTHTRVRVVRADVPTGEIELAPV